jgi:peptidoglycan hydrolase-like protein with peptidoglycan-binding domain
VDDRTGDLTSDVQRVLRHDGYYRGDIDGDIGPGTRAAIRQYQYDHHLEVTGRIDRSLLGSLGIE